MRQLRASHARSIDSQQVREKRSLRYVGPTVTKRFFAAHRQPTWHRADGRATIQRRSPPQKLAIPLARPRNVIYGCNRGIALQATSIASLVALAG